MTQLTEHFSLAELTVSEVAARKGLDNTPDADSEENLRILASYLEQIRALLGVPLHINSAFRAPKVNVAVGGSGTSSHCAGEAADFTARQFGTPQDIAHAIMASDIPYDQLIYEGTWLHFGIREPMRKQELTAHFAGGRVTYTAGIA